MTTTGARGGEATQGIAGTPTDDLSLGGTPTGTAAVSPTSPASDLYGPGVFLSQEHYRRFHARAAVHDRENSFFDDDFEELRTVGYLRAALPPEYGGRALSLAALAGEQRRIAYWAPATALGVTMHLYWTGAAAAHGRTPLGDVQPDVDWLLRAVGTGTVLASGHGEPGNDLGVDDSTTQAVPGPGGSYIVTGRKTFTSLSPVWDLLGIHARDNSDPDHPKLVHAFVDRTSPGVTRKRTWDALGVRASSSDDTVLDHVQVPARQVVGVAEIGAPYPPYIAASFEWYLVLLGNVYFGIARRALDVAIAQSLGRDSRALHGLSHAHKPAVQRQVAQAEVALEAAAALLEKIAAEVDAGRDLGPWRTARLFAAKELAVRTATEVVDTAVQVVGAAAVSRHNELERLYRDVRTGPLHPPNTDTALDIIGRLSLGLLG